MKRRYVLLSYPPKHFVTFAIVTWVGRVSVFVLCKHEEEKKEKQFKLFFWNEWPPNLPLRKKDEP